MERDARAADEFPVSEFETIEPIRWQDQPVPPRRWLLPDWVPQGAVTAIYGDGGTGKSLLAQQLLTCCAAGRPFLGLEVMRCKALGVFCEDDEDELHRRQHAINEALGIDFADLEFLTLVSRVGGENLLMTFTAETVGRATALFEQIAATAKARGVQVIVIDTAADRFGGNENIRPQVRQFISLLAKLARAIDGAVILLAHPSVSGRASGTGEAGSTAWNNSVRSRLTFERLKSDDDADIVDPDLRILSRRKANYAASGVDVTVRWRNGAFEIEGDAAVADGPEARTRKACAETSFLAGMAELDGKKVRCNIHKGQANYAPKLLREKSNAVASYSETELEAAMNALFRAGRIESVEEGPVSRRRSFIRVVQADLPGLDGGAPAASG